MGQQRFEEPGSTTEPVDGGDFRSWLDGLQVALRHEGDSDVPCGACTACCTASQFVHIDPEEADALAHIPAELLFPAPGGQAGQVLMGYDERGHCPMLRDGACSIYAHRPRTCRTYDCRVFAATGVVPDDPLIATRSGRWRFTFASPDDATEQAAIAAAAGFLAAHRAELGGEVGPSNPTQLAVFAVAVRAPFRGPEPPTLAEVEAEVTLRRRRRGAG